MWERFSFYGLAAILTLYMVSALQYTISFAALIYGIYTSVAYLTQLLGGYIADTFLGNRKTMYIGGFLMAIGQFILAYSASMYVPGVVIPLHSSFIFNAQEISMVAGLLCIMFGAGFFKVNISSLVRFLYNEDDKRLDSAFTLFYMGINIGAFFSPLIIGIVIGNNHPELFKYGFLIAGIGLLIGLITFTLLKDKYLVNPEGHPIGVYPTKKEVDPKLVEELKEERHGKNLSKEEKDRIIAIFVLAVIAIFFWAAFEQTSTSITVFTEQYVPNIAPELFQTIDPLSIIILSPIFAAIWLWLSNRNKEPSVISKMGIGMLFLALSFAVLLIPSSMVDNGAKSIPIITLIGLNMIQALAEIFISPTGQSLVAKLSPIKYSSIMMGVWFLSTAIAEILAAFLAGLYPDPRLATKPTLFGIIQISNLQTFCWIFIIISIIISIITLLLRNKITKLMHGIH